MTSGHTPIECRITEPGSGQFESTARVRLLPTTHWVYVHPLASTSQTCWHEARTSRVADSSRLAVIGKVLSRGADFCGYPRPPTTMRQAGVNLALTQVDGDAAAAHVGIGRKVVSRSAALANLALLDIVGRRQA